MAELKIRQARESDLDELFELRLALVKLLEECNKELWKPTSSGKTRMRDEIAGWLTNLHAMVLVAEEEKSGEIVGMVVGSVDFREELTPHVAGIVQVLFVREPYRRSGVGTRLMSKLCEFFASRNARDISLRYAIGNQLAERFWKKVGFEPRIVTAGTNRANLEKKLAKAKKHSIR